MAHTWASGPRLRMEQETRDDPVCQLARRKITRPQSRLCRPPLANCPDRHFTDTSWTNSTSCNGSVSRARNTSEVVCPETIPGLTVPCSACHHTRGYGLLQQKDKTQEDKAEEQSLKATRTELQRCPPSGVTRDKIDASSGG